MASVLDYHSRQNNFAICSSPLGTSISNLRWAVGSFADKKKEPNDITIFGTDPAFSNPGGYVEDDYGYDDGDSPMDSYGDKLARFSSSGSVPRPSSYGGSVSPQPSSSRGLVPLASGGSEYPVSAVCFSPAQLSSSIQSSGEGLREYLATTSEFLRLWDVVTDETGVGSSFVGMGRKPVGTKLMQRAVLIVPKPEIGPLTSMDWSLVRTNQVVTCSVDTTCTVWDVSTQVSTTQLIAHDQAVYDVAWAPSSDQIFATGGADGSVRMFDLRSLDQSTILYEGVRDARNMPANGINANNPNVKPPPPPILRLAFPQTSDTYLAVVHGDGMDVQILDVRYPGTPALELKTHQAPINGIAWNTAGRPQGAGSGGPGWMATVADDGLCALWDLTNAIPPAQPATRSAPAMPNSNRLPAYAHSAGAEVDACAWGCGGEWVGITSGRTVRAIKV